MAKFRYQIPLSIKEKVEEGKSKKISISGDAINEGVTRNKYRYTQEELTNAAKSLVGKPILKDHKEEIDAIVGKVTSADFRNGAVKFEGDVMDEKVKEMIEDGRIENVSIGAKVDDLIKEDINDEEIMTVKGLEFLELSLVAVPGDPNATIAQALAESFKNSEEKMARWKTLEEAETEIARLKKEIEELRRKLKEQPEAEVPVPEAPEAPAEEPKMTEPEVAPAITVEPVTTPEGPAIQVTPEPTETPAVPPTESAKIKILEREVTRLKEAFRNKPKGKVMRTAETSKIIKEGNREIEYLPNGKRFIKERNRNGVSFWMESD